MRHRDINLDTGDGVGRKRQTERERDRESQDGRRIERGNAMPMGSNGFLLRRGKKKQEQFPKGQRHE